MNRRPRFLYHGTTGSHHSRIMFEGLRSRSETGHSNWHGKFESSAEAIYLTDTYPTFFASQAKVVDDSTNEATNLVIYEIDTYLLDSENFCADEDVLTLWMRDESTKLAFKGETQVALGLRLEDRRSQMCKVSAERSLQALGTCAHISSIPLHAITRGLFYGTSVAAEMILRGLDPVINLTNFEMFGEEYKQAVRWLFRFDTEDSGKLSGMEYDKLMTEYKNLPNWPRFNMWKNQHYIGTAEFTSVKSEGNQILTPVTESKK